ncbi:XdhC family protein [Varunaivibrio sulfuroxidans]|uniref:Xanthine dehydrogenase accessory factor n=1 Tax=Varunaivibrio sulfuroxidans TaxID=1773489 RepID=A0A4R3JD71_9PROT|nr:XdhC/CoxI family protein [Varunaivibrio sulfuroxidans]TCS63103.1 xanthine dehydrogenase accessory factor [Varunaivibrio sulfuroxidans]WES31825.1 XdhC family protein [Varunaivibrio sulfuroxidans]
MTIHTGDYLLDHAKAWSRDGLGVALATVVQTWGSSPCPTGSQMVINAKAGFEGSVSGGCIEASVVSESLEALKSGAFEIAEYGVSKEMSFAAGLSCGGSVRVMLEVLDDALLAALSGPRPAVRIVDMRDGKWTVVRGEAAMGRLPADGDMIARAAKVLSTGRACIAEGCEGGDCFYQPLLAPYRMLVVGAVRIAQILAPMAAEVGFHVTVIDPRRAFSTDARFPETDMVREWPDKAVAKLGLDAQTALVALTHDAKPDDMALGLAVRSDAFYVGALGSKRTHASRVARLREAGYTEAEIGRIHAPVGLDIGARTPGEIAVSILAQVIAARNGRA